VSTAVVVSVVDRATATLNKINKSIAGTTAPVRGLSAAMAKLGDTTGISRLGTALGGLSSIGGRIGSALTSVAAPLAAITGAASIGGLARLTTQFSDLTRQTVNTGASIGLTGNQMRQFSAALRIGGVSTETATSAIINLRTTMQDAAWGRNNNAARILSTWGYSLSAIRSGAVDLDTALPDLAARFAAMRDPIAAGALATELFGSAGADLLPILRRGREAMREYLDEGRRSAGITSAQAAAATALGQAQSRLGVAVEGLGTKISTALTPVLLPIISGMSRWIELNGEWLSQNVAGMLDGMATALGSVARAISAITGGDGSTEDGAAKMTALVTVLGGVAAASAITRMTGLGTALGGVVAGVRGLSVLAAANPWVAGLLVAGAVAYGVSQGINPITPERRAEMNGNIGSAGRANLTPGGVAPVRPATGDLAARQDQIVEGLIARGLSESAAIGLAANITAESGGRTNADNPTDGNGGSAGLLQWNGPRRQAFIAQMGVDPTAATMEQQLDFLVRELRGSERGAGQAVEAEPDARGAAAQASLRYVRPYTGRSQGERDNEALRRGEIAADIERRRRAAAGTPTAPSPAPGTAPTGQGLIGPQSMGPSGRVDVVVNLTGSVPAGTTINTRSNAPGVRAMSRAPTIAPAFPLA